MRTPRSRLEQDLGRGPPVEELVSPGRLFQRQPVADDRRWIEPALGEERHRAPPVRMGRAQSREADVEGPCPVDAELELRDLAREHPDDDDPAASADEIDGGLV